MIQKSIPFTELKGVSRLFADYTSDYAQLADYYSGDWRADHSYEALAQEITLHPIDRDVLVDVLLEQNSTWNTTDLINQLRDPSSLAVVTGQQVGIFGGPLYCLYKAYTAIRLAEHLTNVLSRPVVPVFWLEGGDHDLKEVAHLHLQGQEIWYKGHQLPERGNLGSVGSLEFNSQIEQVHGELRECLPQTEFIDDIFAKYYGRYHSGETFTNAFAHTLNSLLGENSMVFLNPEDCRLKEMTAPLLRRELTEHGTTHDMIEATSDLLRQKYHAQVHVRPVNVFLTGDDQRQAMYPEAHGLRLQFSDSEVISYDRIHEIPSCNLSPNVVMRPLVQDSLLPTVAYVAGPGEIAYFAQLKSIYAWAQRPMPIIYPRASVTIIETRVQLLMERHGLTVQEMICEIPDLMRKRVLEGSDLLNTFQNARVALDECIYELKPVVVNVDATLGASVEATRKQWGKELSKLQQRAERAEKRHHQELQSQIEYCKEAIYPNGNVQERELPALYYLAKYGETFLDQIYSHLSLDFAGRHQLLLLE
ncbi:MAG: bacillithiol biosynthesis cysteine-adding enzyme BshC [Bacteroidetes bacterium]|nr:bacillithiol biosynthesis cysteine-adding enzyme BshC [Bacteroidota bacterium]